jgi:hypothetical protein
MSFGKSSPTTAASMMKATPPPAEAKQSETDSAVEAQRENRARAQGLQSTYYRSFATQQASTGTKTTLGS